MVSLVCPSGTKAVNAYVSTSPIAASRVPESLVKTSDEAINLILSAEIALVAAVSVLLDCASRSTSCSPDWLSPVASAVISNDAPVWVPSLTSAV